MNEYMKIAKEMAEKGSSTNEGGPFGAVITDKEGNALCWASSGTQGIKGSKKSTPYDAGKSAEIAGAKAVEMGMKEVEVVVKGLGAGREMAIRSLQATGLKVTKITDETPIPHNGCRPPKKRRG